MAKTILPYVISGISVGGQYALIAIGYTMVYGILRLINFAHGDVFMVAGLMMVYMAASMPLYIAIPLMIVLTVFLGFMIERVAYRPLRTAPPEYSRDSSTPGGISPRRRDSRDSVSPSRRSCSSLAGDAQCWLWPTVFQSGIWRRRF